MEDQLSALMDEHTDEFVGKEPTDEFARTVSFLEFGCGVEDDSIPIFDEKRTESIVAEPTAARFGLDPSATHAGN